VWLGKRAKDPEAKRRVVRGAARAPRGEVRLQLEGVSRREDVQGLIGLLVTASPDLLPALPEGEFYWYELVGCRVESASGEPVGTVREIWETGAHDVLLVQDEDGVRRLVPTAEALLECIDLEARRIVVADVPGLLEPV
ncbi:MAG: ribosome maturation factor RimM, partial [Myxococcota bacterium]